MGDGRDERRGRQRDRKGGTDKEKVTGEGEEDASGGMEGTGRDNRKGRRRGREGGSRPQTPRSFIKVGAYAAYHIIQWITDRRWC